MVTVYFVSFKAIGELQRKDYVILCHSIQLEWTNMWKIPASENLSTVIALSHCPQIVWSLTGIFHTEKIA